ncbi:MAG: FAD-binding protein, partial [Acidimicrobiales bacterium]
MGVRRSGKHPDQPPAGDLEGLVGALLDALPEGRVITERSELRTYECDGLAHYTTVPGVVVLAETGTDVATTVRLCAEHGVAFVARGSGTGLSGGALPIGSGALIVVSRMRRVVETDLANQQLVVEPGVINLEVTRQVAPAGFYYAPDPSSQVVCSIGGNVAENAGGAHCLKYGFTVNHVLEADVVLPDGGQVQLGSRAPDPPGYDLLGAFVGSEGTLGIATRVVLRLMRKPEAVRTLLAAFGSVEDAGATVSAIIGD